jgi:hypothetical protein
MTRDTKWRQKGPKPTWYCDWSQYTPEEIEEFERHAGEGISTRFSDNAFWLPWYVDDTEIEARVTLDKAMPALDKIKDHKARTKAKDEAKAPLIEHLRRSTRMRDHMEADLLERYELTCKTGKQTDPDLQPH